MKTIVPTHINERTAEPSRAKINPDWFSEKEYEAALKAGAQNDSFILKRQGQIPKST